MSAKERDVFIAHEDLSAVTAGGNISFIEFLRINGLKMSDLQANPRRMQAVIEAFGKINYTNGVADEAARRRKAVGNGG